MNATLRRIVKPIAQLTRPASDYGAHSNHRLPTMDDMVKPKGNFQKEFKKRQAKYNTVLIGGFLFLAGSIFSIHSMGLFKGLGRPKIGN